MKIKNPSDKEVTLNYKGELYTIDAESTKDFPSDVASQWVTMFQFMTIEADEVAPKKEEKKEVKKEDKKK